MHHASEKFELRTFYGVLMFRSVLLLTLIIGGLTCQTFSQTKMKTLAIGFTAPSDMMITKADGKRIGYDVVNQKVVNEIKDSFVSESTSGEPLFRLPVGDNEKDLTIKVFGQTPQTNGNLSITGDGFVIRLIGLTLETTKILTMTVQPDGQKIEFSSNQAEEFLKFNFAVDPPDGKQPSYIFKLERPKLLANKKLAVNLDITKGIFNFSDEAKLGSYSITLTKINLDGSNNTFSQAEISSKKANRFQLDFKNWDGKSGICLRIDEDKRGIVKAKCRPLN